MINAKQEMLIADFIMHNAHVIAYHTYKVSYNFKLATEATDIISLNARVLIAQIWLDRLVEELQQRDYKQK